VISRRTIILVAHGTYSVVLSSRTLLASPHRRPGTFAVYYFDIYAVRLKLERIVAMDTSGHPYTAVFGKYRSPRSGDKTNAPALPTTATIRTVTRVARPAFRKSGASTVIVIRRHRRTEMAANTPPPGRYVYYKFRPLLLTVTSVT